MLDHRPTTLALAAALTLACAAPSSAAECEIRIARVLPTTGPLASFSTGAGWVDDRKLAAIEAAGGLEAAGETCSIRYRLYDSASTRGGAAQATIEAIAEDGADLVIGTGTPDTVTAVSDMCERYQTPCVTTIAPNEAWLYTEEGDPIEHEYSFHFFFNVSDVTKTHVAMLESLSGQVNEKIGYIYFTDNDSILLRRFLADSFSDGGFELVDSQRLDIGVPDFSGVIAGFQREGVETVASVILPKDLRRYLAQAEEMGFRPAAQLFVKGLIFPEIAASLGPLADHALSEGWWAPTMRGQALHGGWDNAELEADWRAAHDGAPASATLAYQDAAWDVALDALSRAESLFADDLAAALSATDVETLVGRIAFDERGLSVTPVFGVQWRHDPETGAMRSEIVENGLFPEIPTTDVIRVRRVR